MTFEPNTLWRNSKPYQKTSDLYVLQRNPVYPEKWDVVRNAPTVISQALKQGEAEALVFAMNAQSNKMENPQ